MELEHPKPIRQALVCQQPLWESHLAQVDDHEQLERGFRRLSPEQRAVVVLHYYLDLPLTEVAAIMGIPAGTVRSRLHYAISVLKAALDADGRPTITKVNTA